MDLKKYGSLLFQFKFICHLLFTFWWLSTTKLTIKTLITRVVNSKTLILKDRFDEDDWVTVETSLKI